MKKKKTMLVVMLATLLTVMPVSKAKAENKREVYGYSQNNVTIKSDLSENQIKKILPRNMKALAHDLWLCERGKNPINAIFLASVIRLETGNGTSYSYQHRNNVGGIMGRNGLRTFKNKSESVVYMHDFLNRLYINRGRKNVWNIGSVYCVGGNWSYKVNALANKTMYDSMKYR